jgi:hypothetical protein
VNIANITNSLGPAACVRCFNNLARNRSSPKRPYTYRSLDATQGSTLRNVRTADAGTWVSLHIYQGEVSAHKTVQCHYRGYTRWLAFQHRHFHLEVSWEVSRELKVLTACYEESDAFCPPPVLHYWELGRVPRPLKRTYAEAGKWGAIPKHSS